MSGKSSDSGSKRDWTGDGRSIFKQLGATSHAVEGSGGREENDFYATDPRSIDDLVATGLLDFLRAGDYDTGVSPGVVWEPACGQGHMCNRLRDLGFNVFATDLVDRGCAGASVLDFLGIEALNVDVTGKNIRAIVTNPPYKYCTEFVERSLDVLSGGGIDGGVVCMFLKLTTLEGADRYWRLWSKKGLRYVYVYSHRIECAKNGVFGAGAGSAVCYAWFIWEIGYEGEPVLRWFKP